MALPTTYVPWNISFEVFCIIATALLLYKQLTVFHENDPERALTVVLVIQLAYFASFIPRVLVDMAILPKTQVTVYAVSLVNIALFVYCGYRVFIYLELYQEAPGFRLWGNAILYALPCLFNMVVLFSCPVTGAFLSVAPDASVSSGPYWKLMIVINCFYPSAGLLSFLYRRWRGLRPKRPGDLTVAVVFPLCYAVFGPLSALQWRIPILPFGLMMGELFEYVHYTDLLMQERNERLELERSMAEERDKAKTVFLSNMSHDIRTPMNAIVGYTDLARREDGVPESTRTYLDKIAAASQRLLSLINDVLEMSRIESGKMELEARETDLADVMDKARDLFALQMEEKGIRFTVDASRIRDRRVLCDRDRLDRALLNLVSNAYKFTPEGGSVTVTMEETGAEDGAASYELRVRDTGIGMSPEFAARVFDAFERERTSTVSGIQGTGLGMAITKSIVDLMGGEIRVETEQGKGTEFIIQVRFPIAAPSAVEGPEDASTETDLEISPEGVHVLLVEDNEINREIATLLLTEAGFTLEEAVDGSEAVEKVASSGPGHFDVVLMDIQMPVMDGYAAARAIRALEDPSLADVPIIAMTANAFAEDIQAARDAGMDAHISKPIDVPTMMATLGRVLRESAASGRIRRVSAGVGAEGPGAA